MVMLVYDATNEESFENLKIWLDMLRKRNPDRVLPGVSVAPNRKP
jgi:GTPase SAR1 family protein